MIYFGENNEYILCECDTCKGEMYIEKNAVADEDAYMFHLYSPVKCQCGAIDEYINRSKKSCHKTKQELFALSDLLHKQQNISNKIGEITAELNKKFVSPSFLQSVVKDLIFAGKVFLILLGAFIGVEIFLFIITALMFFFGIAFQAPGIAANGNELFYNINIFKDRGWSFLSKFGLDPYFDVHKPFPSEIAQEELIFYYIPSAVAGVVIVAFYIFLAVLLVRVSINVAKLTFFASQVMNQKIKVNQKREEYQRQLEEYSEMYQSLSDQISEFRVIPQEYKNIRSADMILRYFVNNRADTMREALNLYHDEDYKLRMLEYNKAMYNEMRQTRRYTKALYMMTSDENIKVDIVDQKETKDEYYDSENAKVGEMLKNASSKIKKPPQKKVPQISGEPAPASSSSPRLSPPGLSAKNRKPQDTGASDSNDPLVPLNSVSDNPIEEIKEIEESGKWDDLKELLELKEFGGSDKYKDKTDKTNQIDNDKYDSINNIEIGNIENADDSKKEEQEDINTVLDGMPRIDL